MTGYIADGCEIIAKVSFENREAFEKFANTLKDTNCGYSAFYHKQYENPVHIKEANLIK